MRVLCIDLIFSTFTGSFTISSNFNVLVKVPKPPRSVIMSRIFFLLSYPDAFKFLFLTNFPRQSLLYIQCGMEIVTVLHGDLRRKV